MLMQRRLPFTPQLLPTFQITISSQATIPGSFTVQLGLRSIGALPISIIAVTPLIEPRNSRSSVMIHVETALRAASVHFAHNASPLLSFLVCADRPRDYVPCVAIYDSVSY